jgi:hypothetical protein
VFSGSQKIMSSGWRANANYWTPYSKQKLGHAVNHNLGLEALETPV